MRIRINRCNGLALAFALGTSWIIAAPGAAEAQVRQRAWAATDLGAVSDVGALNNESGVNVTSVVRVQRFINGVSRQTPAIITVDDPCRDRMDLANQSAEGLSINDSRIVVGVQGVEAMEWFPANCPNSVQAGPLPRLPVSGVFQGATAHANNNSRDAVGRTRVITTLNTTQDIPTLWRKVNGGFTVHLLQTPFMPAPLSNIRHSGAAFDINDSGTVVGFTRFGDSGIPRACILRENQDPEILRLEPAAADYIFRLNEARGISNNGFVTGIGDARVTGGRQMRGFVRAPDGSVAKTQIIDNDGLYVASEAYKVNDQGTAVGLMRKSDGGMVAAAWNQNGRLAVLSSMNVEGLPEEAVLTEAVDINDQGDILARGTVNGQTRAFLLRLTGAAVFYFPTSHTY
jgi:hypothetical protein